MNLPLMPPFGGSGPPWPRLGKSTRIRLRARDMSKHAGIEQSTAGPDADLASCAATVGLNGGHERAFGDPHMDMVVSVNVGLPQDVAWQGRTVRTAVWKKPVTGRIFARRLNLDGDGQGDLAGHGGEQRAIMVYQLDSYRYWANYLGRSDLRPGIFGENLTVEGLADAEVCIGDRFRIGSVVVEVTQPRDTCYRLGIRLERPEMPALLVAHHRPGFYLRVIQEGELGAGDRIEKLSDGPERVTIAEIDALLYSAEHPLEALRRAARIPG